MIALRSAVSETAPSYLRDLLTADTRALSSELSSELRDQDLRNPPPELLLSNCARPEDLSLGRVAVSVRDMSV